MKSSKKATLYYIHDPMCSWCWGFLPVWDQVQHALAGKVKIQYVLGGLAPDTQQAMPESMQLAIQETWKNIQQEIPATKFNTDFWKQCHPRRSTYPACRAVLAAGMQGVQYSQDMLLAIQQAYYLKAKNPSDNNVLIDLASEIGLDNKRFEEDFLSQHCKTLLSNELRLASELEAHSFPALALSHKETNTVIAIDYNNSETIVANILRRL